MNLHLRGETIQADVAMFEGRVRLSIGAFVWSIDWRAALALGQALIDVAKMTGGIQ